MSTSTTSSNAVQATSTTDWRQVTTQLGSALAPSVDGLDRSGELAVRAFERVREAGLTTALIPAEFGGGGVSHAEMGDILRQLARSDPSTALALSMHTHLVAAQVWRHLHGIDATRFFRRVIDERALLVSTGASDWLGSTGTTERVDGGFEVSARKPNASGCEAGDIIVTSARWDSGPEGPQVIHFAVPMTAEGISIDKTWDTLGMRATGSHTVVLDHVFVPDAAVSLTRPADQWHPVWNTVIGAAMPLVTAVYLGVADAAVDETLAAVQGRSEAHITHLVGEMLNEHLTAEDLTDAMFREADDLRFDATEEVASRMLSRKTITSESMIRCVRLAIEVVGGAGYSRHMALERLYRDVHGSLFHPLPRGKQLFFTGRVALGLPPVD